VHVLDQSSDSSDCHIMKSQDPKSSSSSSTRYDVKVETSPVTDVRTSSSTLQDEELTGSYTVSSSPRDDFSVRTTRPFYTIRSIFWTPMATDVVVVLVVIRFSIP